MPTFSSDGDREPASCSVTTTMLTNHLPVGVRFTVAGMPEAGERSMHHHLDVSELGEDESAFLLPASLDVKAVLVLLEGEAIVAQARAEAGYPGCCPSLTRLKKPSMARSTRLRTSCRTCEFTSASSGRTSLQLGSSAHWCE